MKTKEQIIYNGDLPKKKKLFVAIFWLDFKITQLLLKGIIKKMFLIHTRNTDYIPGFRCLYGNIYSEDAFLSNSLFLDYAPIYIGKGTNIGFGCTLITSSHNPNNYKEIICDPIWIGANCFIGTNSTILQGVKIGDNVVVGAGSIVTKDIPANSTAVGNPAKIIKNNEK